MPRHGEVGWCQARGIELFEDAVALVGLVEVAVGGRQRGERLGQGELVVVEVLHQGHSLFEHGDRLIGVAVGDQRYAPRPQRHGEVAGPIAITLVVDGLPIRVDRRGKVALLLENVADVVPHDTDGPRIIEIVRAGEYVPCPLVGI